MKLIKRILTVMVAIFAATIMTSCLKEEVEELPQMNSSKGSTEGITLGKRIENAYSITNMQRACRQLQDEGVISNDYRIEASHLYVCFSNLDTASLNYLIEDTSLVLFNYPLDYELIGEGMYIPADGTDTIYTVVPIDYDFNGITHKVIEYCFIPKGNHPKATDRLIEERSLILTGDIEEGNDNPSKGWKIPKGRITVKDNRANQNIGVKRVMVVTRKTVNIQRTYTDANGNYEMKWGYFKSPKYSVTFVNDIGFKIWGNRLCFAPAYYYFDEHSNAGYSYNFNVSSNDNINDAWRWSTINNAAYEYFINMCQQFNIPEPSRNIRIWSLKKFSSFGNGSAPMLRKITLSSYAWQNIVNLYQADTTDLHIGGIFAATLYAEFLAVLHTISPDIFILGKLSDSTYDINRTVYHELAHASHFQNVGAGYWVQFVNQIIAHIGYGDHPDNNNGIIGVGEMWANYFEYICRNAKYQDTNINSYSRWFRPQILKEIYENIPGLTPRDIYDCMTIQAIDHSSLKEIMKTNMGQLGRDYSDIIENKFHEHGF